MVPATSGALFAGFASVARPAPDPVRQATTGTQKTYSLYDKGKQLLGLGVVAPVPVIVETPFTTVAPLVQVSGGELAVGTAEEAAIFTEAAPLFEVSGGELALAGGSGGGGAGAGGISATAAVTTTASATGGAPAAGAVAAGTAAGETVGLLGILGPAGILAGVTVAVATGVHMLIKGLLPRELPFGRGKSFSSADNISSQKSKLLGLRGAEAVIAYIKGHGNFRDLIQLANSGANLSPHGEVLFHHPVVGSGATFYNNASPDYSAMIASAWNGNVRALNDFVRGIEVYTGETGATHPHWEATDWYRRSLVHSVPQAIQDELAPLDTIWQPMPGYANMAETITAYLFPGGSADRNALEVVNAAGGIDAYLAARVREPWNGCPYFRDVNALRLTPDQAAQIAAQWPSRAVSALAENDQRWLAYSQSGGE